VPAQAGPATAATASRFATVGVEVEAVATTVISCTETDVDTRVTTAVPSVVVVVEITVLLPLSE
jgi:hypothetical protein